MIPYWTDTIMPLVAGKTSDRRRTWQLLALVKHLDGISDEEIVSLNIPTGVPMLYEFNDSMVATGRHYQ